MKKVLLVVAILVIAMHSFGQTKKDRVIFSSTSDLSYSSYTTKLMYKDEERLNYDISEFNIQPTIGVFVLNNLALALSMDYERTKQDETKSRSILAGPSVRYYFGSSNIKPYFNANYMLGSMKAEDEDDEEEEYKASGWDVGAGLAIFINNYISLDFGLDYGASTIDYEDENVSIEAKGVSASVGFTIVL